ncbi:helix-turn-helix transcriptional regulator [Micromonospora sp. WMMD980]|uniref:helix-turn-helix domain-containing protein n=1 Tax=Micromonospora sp. WMMD980 TaxID=3016088 RepID=UPI0024162281|nr:helix-turn-helix transcriptional regulator [Micromonospora sp. WMMD980]MDG4799032.1 helix-turn-helix transcriptional regulator [Micromonospora sp. WMMD980]
MTSRANVDRSLPVRADIGDAIREGRHALGMTQRQFAAISGIRQCSVSYIERATRDILASTLIDAAATVGLHVALAAQQHLPLLQLTPAEARAVVAAVRAYGNPNGHPHLDTALRKLTDPT